MTGLAPRRKTTAMLAIFGAVGVDEGEVRLRGEPVGGRARRRFGYMPEERGLYPGMRVGEQLECLGRLHNLSAPRAPCRRHALVLNLPTEGEGLGEWLAWAASYGHRCMSRSTRASSRS